MSSRFKNILQYVVILAVTAVLIWFSLRGLAPGDGEGKFDFLLETWARADKGWLYLMAGIAMVSHFLRAERWRMLITPAGFDTRLSYSFLSLMVGYLVNLVIPRGGEVTRCYNLYKLDKTPVEISFGTVVVERVVDVLCLLSLLAIAFVVESEKLLSFIETLPFAEGQSRLGLIVIVALVGLALLGGMIWLIKKNKRLNSFARRTWHGFREGLLSVFKLKRKGLFIAYSIIIWVLYFIMSYTVIRAFPQTDHLGFSAVLSMFAIGSIAMAAPLPGGTGSYHVLVPQGLVFLYQIHESDAIAFTFIFHGWQTAIMIVGGAISLILTSVLVKKRPGPF